ncbi:hypothetical protein PPERSA_10007 [Pseudocohnilembus persalinus]|uniref:inosine/xanthosine triphosphatase n=1 Tax=Pseudocohnilembus persalinus TaxID=266149 RepID=A0A0V0QJL3_PSEPJ|nr:hypothetical protein PPERSA_10007 [Pseudocohnilembus persalinus]|eukprot:KRX02390.1 hypothetical protein PPERSA_10007 [Pseudocohnilembus persalinus]
MLNLQNTNFPKQKESAFFLGIFGLIFTGALILKQKKGTLHLSNSYNDFSIGQSKQLKPLLIDESESESDDDDKISDKERKDLYLEDYQLDDNKKEKLYQIKKSLKVKNGVNNKKYQEEQLLKQKLFLEKILGIKDVKQKEKIRVLVTSQNQEKINAIESALKEVFPDFYLENGKVIIQAQKSESGISHGQPWGIQHTFEGAHNRIENIKQKMQNSQVFDKLNGYDLIISIENGVFPLLSHTQTRGYDIACIVIERKVDKQIIQQQQQNEKEDKLKKQKLQESALNLFGSQKNKSSMASIFSSVEKNKQSYIAGQSQVFSWERQIGFSMPRLYPLQNVQLQVQNGKTNKEMGKYIAQYYENKQFSLSRHDQIKEAIINTFNQFL